MTKTAHGNRKLPDATRRTALKLMAALPMAAVAPRIAWAAGATPSATEGPFYPTPAMRFTDTDRGGACRDLAM